MNLSFKKESRQTLLNVQVNHTPCAIYTFGFYRRLRVQPLGAMDLHYEHKMPLLQHVKRDSRVSERNVADEKYQKCCRGQRRALQPSERDTGLQGRARRQEVFRVEGNAMERLVRMPSQG